MEVDGRNIALADKMACRDDIALVPQDSTLFDGSVRFNLALGARTEHDATNEEIETACRLANAHDVIAALPQGYETPCGANGDRYLGRPETENVHRASFGPQTTAPPSGRADQRSGRGVRKRISNKRSIACEAK